MSRLIRLDRTGHTELASWTAENTDAQEAAIEAFRRELDEGMLASATLADDLGRSIRPRGARQHALVQLAAESLYGRLLGGRVPGDPGGKLRVTRPIQSDQPRHADPSFAVGVR